MTQWKRILSPLASLRLTVTLLILSMLLVFAGTLAQRDQGVWQVQDNYFHSLFCWVPLHNFIFRAFAIHGKQIMIPMPGGYLVGLLLLINLLAAVANIVSRLTGPAVAGAASVHPDANPAQPRTDA